MYFGTCNDYFARDFCPSQSTAVLETVKRSRASFCFWKFTLFLSRNDAKFLAVPGSSHAVSTIKGPARLACI